MIKQYFFKKGGPYNNTFRGSNFKEITTKIKSMHISNIKITRNLKNNIKNYSNCSKKIKEYILE
jgi:hypothetical protein